MHATVKFGVIKMKPVNISHGGQMACFKISVFIIQTVENLIFDVWTALQAPEQIAVRINEILKNQNKTKDIFSVKRLRSEFAIVEWAAGPWWRATPTTGIERAHAISAFALAGTTVGGWCQT